MPAATQVTGKNTKAPFKLKIHRGEGAVLLAMNWKDSPPPADFAGFAIEYREPGKDRFFAVKNRLTFEGKTVSVADGVQPKYQTTQSPIQKFRWVHFPQYADLPGPFRYRVTPMFMNKYDELSTGEPQEADIELAAKTYTGQVNIAFTRGYVSSQAFANFYGGAEGLRKLLPEKADLGLKFKSSHEKAEKAYQWMGFEARREILRVLDAAIADPSAKVSVIAYDLNLPELVERFEALKSRLRIIIDNSTSTKKGKTTGHGTPESAETEAAQRLTISAGADNVKRQNMGKLQHNKSIVIDGDNIKIAVGGSTNFSWRGFYVQSNNAVIVEGAEAIQPFAAAFESYWANEAGFKASAPAKMTPIPIGDVDMAVSFSPHAKENLMQDRIADIIEGAQSSLFYSLAFLDQTPGVVTDALEKATNKSNVFVYGISDGDAKFVIERPDGNRAPVYFKALSKNAPAPFQLESDGEFGARVHHKFVVIDFDKPKRAKVLTGSYNFSKSADDSNGENLLIINDHRIAVAYMVEALRLFDTYSFRIAFSEAKKKGEKLQLKKPPRQPDEKPWWDRFYTKPADIRDRELFS